MLPLKVSRQQHVPGAEAGRHWQRWHQLAASLAGIPDAAGSAAVPLGKADASADQIAAVIQQHSRRLGRIEDLVAELDSLRLRVAALSRATAQHRRIELAFLRLEAELKFSVVLDIGKSCAMLRAGSCYPATWRHVALQPHFEADHLYSSQVACCCMENSCSLICLRDACHCSTAVGRALRVDLGTCCAMHALCPAAMWTAMLKATSCVQSLSTHLDSCHARGGCTFRGRQA